LLARIAFSFSQPTCNLVLANLLIIIVIPQRSGGICFSIKAAMNYTDYEFFVYILASKSRTLYIGVTNDLMRRVQEHKDGKSSFTKRYRIDRLVYFERFQYINSAIARETELKDWRRDLKDKLIEAINPTWDDLSLAPPARYKPGEELKADSGVRRNDKKV
jgi:putative endonuclease